MRRSSGKERRNRCAPVRRGSPRGRGCATTGCLALEPERRARRRLSGVVQQEPRWAQPTAINAGELCTGAGITEGLVRRRVGLRALNAGVQCDRFGWQWTSLTVLICCRVNGAHAADLPRPATWRPHRQGRYRWTGRAPPFGGGPSGQLFSDNFAPSMRTRC